MELISNADFVLDGRGMVLGSVANFYLDSFQFWWLPSIRLSWSIGLNLEPVEVGANGWSINTLCKSKWFSCRTSYLMPAVSDSSNRNGGTMMGLGGAERIASNLIRRLLLVSDIIFLFGVHYCWTCMVLMCVPSFFGTLRTMMLLYVPSLFWTLCRMVLLCVTSLLRTFLKGVLMSVPLQVCWSRQILVLMSSPSLDNRSRHTLALISFPYLNGRSLWALVFKYFSWPIFPGSGAVKFIFLPVMSRCSFDASLWWNGFIPMPFALFVCIYTFV